MTINEGTTTDAAQLVRSSASVALGTMISRVSGLVRVGVLAYALGRATLADSYNLANTTPNIIYELLVGGVLSATLVPMFVDHLTRRDEEATSAVFSVTLALLAGVAVVGFFAAPLIAHLYAIDVDGSTRDAQLEVITFLVRCFVPQIFFYGVTALAAAALHARRRYLAAAYAPVLNNVVVICSLLAFTRLAEGPQAAWENVDQIRSDTGLLLLLGLGTTAGIVAMAMALVPALTHAGVHLRPVFQWRHAAVRQLIRLSGWTVGYVIANQITLLFVLVLAHTGEPGDVSAYQYAFMFFQLPHGLLAVSLMTTTTPELARQAAAGDRAGLSAQFSTGLRLMGLVMIPASILLAVLAQPAVAVLVRGGFDAQDAAVTADILQVFAIGLVPFSIYLYTLRVFYAYQDTRTPFVVNLVENAANIALALALFGALGVQGLALAYGGAYLVAAVLALWWARRKVDVSVAPMTALLARALAAGAVLAAVAAPLAAAIGHASAAEAALATTVAAVAGGIAYFVVLTLLRTEELRDLGRAVRRRGGADIAADIDG